ncbi:MAG: hypothetical protein JNM03_02430 [Sphingopyxis sp.]|jgi:hypothetical protein|uniref:hypothetical protein n=1 Tax=Sphingopyxis sp. TaxID=1908224 RepID=UPI001A4F79CA|nr:hypothetical protein [Sphingopyxis sp.]MBL9068831.1 hypothetical protein [Sphingopyxis sp.]
MTMKFFAAVLASGVSATALYAPSACAQTGELTYNIEAQRLSDALRKYSDISGREVIAASSLLEGRRSNRVRGRLSPDAALSPRTSRPSQGRSLLCTSATSTGSASGCRATSIPILPK